jgi:BirA family biotin operon repressor/biotin-[acetyl-CoA-carboxylase] ligase
MNKPFPNYTKALIPKARQLRQDMTDAERKLWSKLRNNQLGVKFRRQVPFDNYILDFYCASAKLCVELDGGQHITNEGIQKDQKRDRDLKEKGVEVLRFSDADALKNTDGVLQVIREKVKNILEQKTPS